jgi:hypothetical protein
MSCLKHIFTDDQAGLSNERLAQSAPIKFCKRIIIHVHHHYRHGKEKMMMMMKWKTSEDDVAMWR